MFPFGAAGSSSRISKGIESLLEMEDNVVLPDEALAPFAFTRADARPGAAEFRPLLERVTRPDGLGSIDLDKMDRHRQ
jgi:hypothetical protein